MFLPEGGGQANWSWYSEEPVVMVLLFVVVSPATTTTRLWLCSCCWRKELEAPARFSAARADEDPAAAAPCDHRPHDKTWERSWKKKERGNIISHVSSAQERERDGIFCVRGGLAKATEKALYTQPLQHNTNGRTNRKRQVQKTKELIQGRRNKKHRNIRGS